MAVLIGKNKKAISGALKDLLELGGAPKSKAIFSDKELEKYLKQAIKKMTVTKNGRDYICKLHDFLTSGLESFPEKHSKKKPTN